MRSVLQLGLLALILTACSPNLAPLYQDYEVTASNEAAPLQERIAAALSEAGWTPSEAPTANVIGTETRTLSNWGLYSVEVDLEVTPIGTDHVRILVHPYRKYFTGARSKIPFMRSSLRRQVLKDLEQAFVSQGLTLQGDSLERDGVTR